MSTILIVGRKAICQYVGENYKSINGLVLSENLPAWKTGGVWKARPEDLKLWVDKQAEKYLQFENIKKPRQ